MLSSSKKVQVLLRILTSLCWAYSLILWVSNFYTRTRSIKLAILMGGLILAGVFYAVLRREWMIARFLEFPRRVKIGAILATVGVTLALYVVLPLYLPAPLFARPGQAALFQLVLAMAQVLAEAVSLATIVFLLGIWLIKRPDGALPGKRVWFERWFGYALPALIAWSLNLLAFWPGMMSDDSLNQWAQVQSGHFVDHHPAIHTLLLWLITRLWMSPAAIAAAQIIVLALVVGWGIQILADLGVPRWQCWLVSLGMAFSPISSMLAITLWKDVLYSAWVLLLVLLTLQTAETQGRWLDKTSHWILCGVIISLVALFRHNGVITAFGSLVVLLLVFPRHRLPVLSVTAVGLGMVLFVRGVIYPLVKVEPSHIFDQTIIHQVAAFVHANVPLATEERAYLDTLTPENRWIYNCYTNVATFSTPFNWENLNNQRSYFYKIYLSLVWRYPAVLARHILCSSSILWRIQPYPDAFTYGPELNDIQALKPERFSVVLASQSRLPGLKSILLDGQLAILQSNWISLIWRPAVYLYAYLVIFAVSAFRGKNWLRLLPIAPILVQTLGLIPVTTSQDFRFQFSVYLAATLLWPLALRRKG